MEPVLDTSVGQEEVEAWLENVSGAIGSLGGAVFPKLNWSSPKDARWVATGHTLKCTSADDVCLLLKASEFVSFDLHEALQLCEEGAPDDFQFQLNLRRWAENQAATEFRLFIRNRRLVVVADVWYTLGPGPTEPRPLVVHLLDLNVWDPVTDSLLFSWDQLQGENPGDDVVEVRLVEDDSMRTSSYDIYGLPIDVQGAESKDILELISGIEEARMSGVANGNNEQMSDNET